MPPSRRSRHVSRVTKPKSTAAAPATARRTRSSLRANTNNQDDSIDQNPLSSALEPEAPESALAMTVPQITAAAAVRVKQEPSGSTLAEASSSRSQQLIPTAPTPAAASTTTPLTELVTDLTEVVRGLRSEVSQYRQETQILHNETRTSRAETRALRDDFYRFRAEFRAFQGEIDELGLRDDIDTIKETTSGFQYGLEVLGENIQALNESMVDIADFREEVVGLRAGMDEGRVQSEDAREWLDGCVEVLEGLTEQIQEIKMMPVTGVAANQQQRNGYYDQDGSDDDELDDYDRVRDKVNRFVDEMTGVLPAGYRICF
ncbi:hypothetical protein AOL_s00097g243 [Orbilia oligospora ATCC 24927]|uniref:Uncharacterized protein n=1 Tax=Arthrobotrys oligospora (strain ATCC 24927 / CBS 115.81 / DSM 1491) TaxID=756982 RepID=G1XIR6_ARTOA|nr:hypothetical protein AOL_s00097g243 [Orbilia oligospora ATCC 24927]EGX46817.1 hypothetical protein AOL_s00097g243 [Orbilia oligospora ATCC 24927]